jgi:hypothetical protein
MLGVRRPKEAHFEHAELLALVAAVGAIVPPTRPSPFSTNRPTRAASTRPRRNSFRIILDKDYAEP